MPTAANQNPTYRLFGGDIVTIKATAADTQGAYTVLETITPAGKGPPPHVHHREEEAFYVVEGEFEFVVGGKPQAARKGDFLIAPKDVPHVFRNAGSTDGKMLIICRPAGFEQFVEEFAQIPPDAPPDIPRMVAIGQRHGIEFVLGPPVYNRLF